MHITVWLDNPDTGGRESVYDFDLSKREDVERLAEYLNYHSRNRRYEVSELGERVPAGGESNCA